MNSLLIEKFKDNLIAFLVGVFASGSTVWSIAENIHKKEVAVLEREQTELQKKLDEMEVSLTAARQAASMIPVHDGNNSATKRKQEIEALIQTLDAEIKAKKEELVRSAGLKPDDQNKDPWYIRIESELHSLQRQRDDARQRLIQVVGD